MHIMLLEAIDRVERGLLATILASKGHTYKKVGEKAFYEVGGLLPIYGNIGAGCMDQEIMSQGKGAYADSRPRIVRIDTSEPTDIVFGYGTFCGGVIEVLIEPVFDAQKAVYRELKDRLEEPESPGRQDPFYLVHDLETGELSLLVEEPRVREKRFVETIVPPIPLYLFGATPLAFQVVKFLEEMDFRIHVIDWRESYIEKFETMQHVRRHSEIDSFPDGAYVLVMSHYFERDRDILGLALRHRCPYVGLLSSRKRRDTIFEELAADGIPDEALKRVSSPAGIDIRSVTDPEIAISIVAELVATRNRDS